MQDAAADGRVGSDNTFRLAGALGRFRLDVDGVPPGWTVKSITAGTADLMTTGTEATSLDGNTRVRVVLTDKVTELTGSVRNERGERVTECVVVVLPSERIESGDRSEIRAGAATRSAGRVSRARIAAGTVQIAAAMQTLEEGAHWDPAFRQRCAAPPPRATSRSAKDRR